MYSYLSSQIAAERQRDLLAGAAAGRLARQARARRPGSPGGRRAWRLGRWLRPVTRVPV